MCSPNTHIWRRIRQATRRVSKCAGGIKTEHSRAIVGCSPEEFNEYWERKVQVWARERGMKSVEGVVFVIDHIKVFISKTTHDLWLIMRTPLYFKNNT